VRPSWEPVARSEQVAGPGFVRAEAGGGPVLVTRLSDGSVVAFGTICPHQGMALDEGSLWEDEVECPHHHYTYDPRTGENRFPKQVVAARKARGVPGIPVFAAKEEDGWVYVAPQHRQDQ
jgi:nitrite reductase/ring-hydroxylating ferredoxin subunit